MANYNSKKRKKAGAKVKPIEEMVDNEKTSADSYFEKIEESKNKGDIEKMGNVVDMKDVFVNDVEIATDVERELKEYEIERQTQAEEYFSEQDEEDVRNKILDEIVAEIDAENEEVLRQQEILDSHIRYAIYSSKELGKRGILSKQFKSIVNGYEHTLGVKMSEEQQLYIRKLTEEQAKAVLNVINKYNRYKTNKEIQKRIARKLATNE